MWEQLSFSFTFGLISSIGICLASCTPVLIAYLISTERDPRKFIGWILLFTFLRALVFMAVTIVILMLGRMALAFIDEYARVLHLIGGLLISAAGVLIFFDIGTRLKFFKTKSKGFLLLSCLFGIKPCLPHLAIWGYILTVVASPMLEGNISFQSALFSTFGIAAAFSVGENAVPAVAGLLGGGGIRFLRGNAFKIVSKACGVVLFALGIVFIFYDSVAPVLARLFR